MIINHTLWCEPPYNGTVSDVQSTTADLPVQNVWAVDSLQVFKTTRNWQQSLNCSLLGQGLIDDEWTKI